MVAVDQLSDFTVTPTKTILYWFGRTHGTKIPFLQTYNTIDGTKCAITFQFGSQQAPDDPEAYFVTRYFNRNTVLAVNMNTEVLVIYIKLTTAGSCPSSASSDMKSRSYSLPSSTNGLRLRQILSQDTGKVYILMSEIGSNEPMLVRDFDPESISNSLTVKTLSFNDIRSGQDFLQSLTWTQKLTETPCQQMHYSMV